MRHSAISEPNTKANPTIKSCCPKQADYLYRRIENSAIFRQFCAKNLPWSFSHWVAFDLNGYLKLRSLFCRQFQTVFQAGAHRLSRSIPCATRHSLLGRAEPEQLDRHRLENHRTAVAQAGRTWASQGIYLC
jgi:hypothetical protein